MFAFGRRAEGQTRGDEPEPYTVAPLERDASGLLLQGANHVPFMETLFANGAPRNTSILKSSAAGMRRLMKQGSPLPAAPNAEII